MATFQSMKELDNWNFGALETINRNIVTQHSEMREHLQDRHQDMATDIVEFIEESTNTVAGYFTAQTEWLHDNMCTIYKTVANVNTCEGDRDTLLGLVGLSLWGKMTQIEAQGETIMETIEMMSSPLHDETKEFGLKAVSSNMDREESDSKVNIMQINLSSMKDTMESMKHKVDTIENSVDTIENSVESMKHKVDTIEKTMKAKVDIIEKSMYAVVSKMDAVTESVIKLTEQLSKNFDKK